MARIGIDARFAVEKRRGIGNYCLQLINHLVEIDHENQYFLYVHKTDDEYVLPQKVNFHVRHIDCGNYLIWEQLLLPIYAAFDRIEVLHCTGNTAPVFLRKDIKKVMTIHDVAYLKSYDQIPRSKSIYQQLGRIYRKNVVPRAAKNADKFITVSQFAKNDIVNSIPCITDSDIFVTHLGIGDSFQTIDKKTAKDFLRQRFGIDYNYIFGLAAQDPQKNTMRLIKNFLVLVRETNLPCKLVLAGLQDWPNSEFYRFVMEQNALEQVVFLDFIQHDELKYLYSATEFFIFPSLYESFGFPPLEAMSCGAPVITSNTGAIPEIVDGAARLIDPQNDVEFQVAMQEMFFNKKLRFAYVQKGFKRVGQFSWAALARKTLDVYTMILKENVKK